VRQNTRNACADFENAHRRNLTNILQNGSLGTDRDNQIIAVGDIDTSRVLATLGRLSLVKPAELSVRLGDEEGAGAILSASNQRECFGPR
jgi:hypothetical protein